MSKKRSDAFRTISEVAQDLGLQNHVLRFWETKFTQVKPMKRGGNRRYYRPEDVLLLRGIMCLLYRDNYKIQGVQKLFRDHGVDFVKAIGAEAEDVFELGAGFALNPGDKLEPRAKSNRQSKQRPGTLKPVLDAHAPLTGDPSAKPTAEGAQSTPLAARPGSNGDRNDALDRPSQRAAVLQSEAEKRTIAQGRQLSPTQSTPAQLSPGQSTPVKSLPALALEQLQVVEAAIEELKAVRAMLLAAASAKGSGASRRATQGE